MLTASKNILQEEWVQCWLDKLTPKQKTLVIEVLKDGHQHRTPTQAALQEAHAVVTHCDSKATTSRFLSQRSNLSEPLSSVR